MTLEPLLAQNWIVISHAAAAAGAVVLGAVQLAAPKGRLPHRTLGYVWAALMLWIAAGSFWIHELRLFGPWSPIHLLSVLVLVSVPRAVWRARAHRVDAHRRSMITLYAFALLVAGVFTLYPGRVLHQVLFGG